MKKIHAKHWVTALLLVVLAAFWVRRSFNAETFREAQYRDTTGLAVTVVSWERTAGAYRVNAVLDNRGQRTAHSVMLTGEVRDHADDIVAYNPLINVLDVRAADSKSFEAMFPTSEAARGARVVLRPVVVDWEEHPVE